MTKQKFLHHHIISHLGIDLEILLQASNQSQINFISTDSYTCPLLHDSGIEGPLTELALAQGKRKGTTFINERMNLVFANNNNNNNISLSLHHQSIFSSNHRDPEP